MNIFKSMTASILAMGMIASVSNTALATLVSIQNCGGAALSCTITNNPPNPIVANPNNDLLLAWDEIQNFTLTQDLVVDQVFDPNASFVTSLGNGQYSIAAGTVVSSHYLQWDPDTAPQVAASVQADIQLDSQAFAIIGTDQTLINSDYLGLPSISYNGFSLRGLESSDLTSFNGNTVTIDWTAGVPGDWARLITAFSPSAPTLAPTPGIFSLLLFAMFILFFGQDAFRAIKR